MKRHFLCALAVAAAGCGTLSNPPLPKMAANPVPRPAREEESWVPQLRQAKVIYLTLRRAVGDLQPVWRIIAALQSGGQPVTLGWAQVSTADQPLLDHWQRREISSAQLLSGLADSGQAPLLGQVLRPDLRHLALGAGRELLLRIRSGARLSETERSSLPNGYRPQQDAFDEFVDRVTASPRLRRYKVTNLYRAHLVAAETIADRIVQFVSRKENGPLLIILPAEFQISAREIAAYTAQKATVRQLVIDPAAAPAEAHRPLLADGHERL